MRTATTQSKPCVRVCRIAHASVGAGPRGRARTLRCASGKWGQRGDVGTECSGRPECCNVRSDEQPCAKTDWGQGRLLLPSAVGVIVALSVASQSSVFDSGGVTAVAAAASRLLPSGDVALAQAMDKAFRGGAAGAAAQAINVMTLMWMRTTVNFQYRYGLSTEEALRKLYKEGGVRRFYRGLLPALVQAPLSRFGDTFANVGILAILEGADGIPVFVKTACASLAAASFRYLLTPIDTLKTTMQVEGPGAGRALANKIKMGGPGVLWAGGAGSVAATFVGHYPWFATYNTLQQLLSHASLTMNRAEHPLQYLLVNALIGFCASAVSDTCSNGVRVLKTVQQTSAEPITYAQAFAKVVEKDGVDGLLLRGLKTKILSNGVQGICFSVLWRLAQDYLGS